MCFHVLCQSVGGLVPKTNQIFRCQMFFNILYTTFQRAQHQAPPNFWSKTMPPLGTGEAGAGPIAVREGAAVPPVDGWFGFLDVFGLFYDLCCEMSFAPVISCYFCSLSPHKESFLLGQEKASRRGGD